MQETRADRFPTTRWSLIATAAAEGGQRSREALCTFCGLYWYPLYAFIRRQGYSVEDTQDLTQAYFVRLLDKDYLRDFQPARGRFRTFLLASLKHFLANERDWARAQKRGAGQSTIPLELAFSEAEQRYSSEPRDNMTPEQIFEKQWAKALLQQVQRGLREEWERAGKGRQFELLDPFVTGEANDIPYNRIAAELATSEGAIKVAVYRLRRRSSELLRKEIAKAVESPEQVDDEIRFVLGAAQR